MSVITRDAPNDARSPGTLSLKTWPGRKSSKLAGGSGSEDSLESFESQLLAAVAIWKSRRRASGLFSSEHPFSKTYAGEVLNRLLSQLPKGGIE